MGWLQTDVRFNDHFALFVVGRHDIRDHTERAGFLNVMARKEASPDDLERMVRNMILDARPELSGCVIWWMGFNAASVEWEFGVAHASLSAVPSGCMAKRERLYRDEGQPQSWRDQPAQL
jgi:hypothetical protein